MERLGKHIVRLDVHRHLAGTRTKEITLDADEVAQVEVTFENSVGILT